MIEELSRAWQQKARAALAWREGQPLEPVLEALALTVAVELSGDLAEQSPSMRDELRRLGQRALLHVGTLLAADARSSGEDAEDVEHAMRLAVTLARDGLRALSGRAPEGEPASSSSASSPAERAPAATAREIARLVGGRLDAYEAATVAWRIRASASAREELTWAMRQAVDEPSDAAREGRGGSDERVRLAAAEGEEMRDPSAGRKLRALLDPTSGALVAEVFAFADRAIAVYASSGDPVRVEGPGLRTDAMQAGYWAGRHEGAGAVDAVAHVGDARHAFRLELDDVT